LNKVDIKKSDKDGYEGYYDFYDYGKANKKG
jgi:hypothetical protein